MNSRTGLTILALAVCLGSVWAVLAQKQQLAVLRAQRQVISSPSVSSAEDPTLARQNKSQTANTSSDAISEELLRLRSEVTRLNRQKRGLAGAVEENERLRAQLESSGANALAGSQLPAGYMRKAQAHFAGYSTPENTFQSFLWGLQNHDTTILLQSLTPGTAQSLQARLQDPSQAAEFFKDMDALPGLAIQNRRDQLDGSVKFEVEAVPGMRKEDMRLQLIDGEWKLDLPF